MTDEFDDLDRILGSDWRTVGGSDRYILDAEGNPKQCPDLLEWGHWMQESRNTRARVVAQDIDEGPDGGQIRVSTVFLGLDHSFAAITGDPTPILWETMVFGGPLDMEQERYTSRADAFRGHQAMCARVKKALATK